MLSVVYLSIFAVSLIFSVIYLYMWHKHFDVNFTMIFTLVPVACLGYALQGGAKCLEGAVYGTQIVYLGGCFLQFFILFSILNLCRINVSKWIRVVAFSVCACIYASVLTIGHLDVFYRNMRFRVIGGSGILYHEYGFMHTVFYAVICLAFLIGLIAIAYSLLRKKQVPRTIIYLLTMPYGICMLGFFVGRRMIQGIDLVPLCYVLAQAVYLLIAYRVNLYDISDTVIDSMVQEQTIGYISFDFRHRYLGSNEVAQQLFPELKDTAVDEMFGYKPSQRQIRHYMDHFDRTPEHNTYVYTLHDPEGYAERDRFYAVQVNYLYDGIRKRGYIVTLTDDTAKQKYIRLLDDYNEDLQKKVAEKTEHIVEMHDHLIMSLAMMVESRDNSTGGHIKRTSEGVRSP